MTSDICPVCLVNWSKCRYTPQPTDRASALLAKGMDMNHRMDRWGGLVVGYCVAARYYLAAMALVSVLQMARGQEELPPPVPKLPGANSSQILIDHRPRIVIL